MSERQEIGSKVTLSSGKVVLLREPQIEFQSLASQRIGGKAGDDKFTYMIMLNKEMIRLMIHSVDGKKVSQKDLLSLDEHFTLKDFNELSRVVTQLTGGDDPLELNVETVPFGDK